MRTRLSTVFVVFLALAAATQPLAQQPADFSFALTGDSIITRKLSVYNEPAFMRIIELVRGADVAFTNLEMLFHDYEPYAAAASGGTYMRAEPARDVESLGDVRLGDLAPDQHTEALLRRRVALGLPVDGAAPVLVDHLGDPPDDVPMALRRARSTRISIDGNAHFCRGLLRTRYPGSEADQVHRADGAEAADVSYDPTFVPLTALTTAHPKENVR